MRKLRYLVSRVTHMHWDNLFSKMRQIHAKSGRNWLWIIYDVIRVGIKFQAGYVEYLIFKFWKLTDEEKATFNTRGYNNYLVTTYTTPEARKIFANKILFNAHFGKYLGRESHVLAELDRAQFDDFVARNPVFFAKPAAETCGHGIERIDSSRFATSDETWDYVHKGTFFLVEEPIKQHPVLQELYPTAVNTIRVITLLIDGVVYFVVTALRMGMHGNVVDNLNAGGLAARIDTDNGLVISQGIDRNDILYPVHPDTGVAIKGLQIPFWDEMLAMVREAAQVVPEMGYVAWDVVITPTGVGLIEANDYPGNDIQITYGRIGEMPRINQIMKDVADRRAARA